MFDILSRAVALLAIAAQAPGRHAPIMVVAHDCTACASVDLYEEFYRHTLRDLRPIVQHPYSFAVRRGMEVQVLDRDDRFRPPWYFIRTADRRLGVIRQDDVLTNDLVFALP